MVGRKRCVESRTRLGKELGKSGRQQENNKAVREGKQANQHQLVTDYFTLTLSSVLSVGMSFVSLRLITTGNKIKGVLEE